MKKVSDTVELMDRWYGGDEEWDQMVQEEEIKGRVSQIIYELRTKASLTQTDLARLVGTTQSIISRLENAEYEGSPLEMFMRICFVLHKKIVVCGPGAPPPMDAQVFCGIGVAS